MGCCCSSEQDDSIQDGEPNERTRLLQDPTNNVYQVTSGSNEYGNHYVSSNPARYEEQSGHSKILQDAIGKVIDVGALEYQSVEDQECQERARLFTKRLQTLSFPPNMLEQINKTSLLHDTPSVQKVLSVEPISSDDYHLMTYSSSKLLKALDRMQVEADDQLVVPFRKI